MISLLLPTHGPTATDGGGLSHSRERTIMPSPQVVLQQEKALQAPHPPASKKFRNKIPESKIANLCPIPWAIWQKIDFFENTKIFYISSKVFKMPIFPEKEQKSRQSNSIHSMGQNYCHSFLQYFWRVFKKSLLLFLFSDSLETENGQYYLWQFFLKRT
jgi:hypothetical protein